MVQIQTSLLGPLDAHDALVAYPTSKHWEPGAMTNALVMALTGVRSFREVAAVRVQGLESMCPRWAPHLVHLYKGTQNSTHCVVLLGETQRPAALRPLSK